MELDLDLSPLNGKFNLFYERVPLNKRQYFCHGTNSLFHLLWGLKVKNFETYNRSERKHIFASNSKK